MGAFERMLMRTLVLNAGYEPLAVVSFKRALILVLNKKATVLESASDQVVHSSANAFEVPSVILLSRYVRIPGSRLVPVSRRGVLRRDSHRCAYCGRSADTIDHVHPRSKGGQDTWQNLVACCFACNNKKGDKTLSELGWRLGFVPKAPEATLWQVRGAEKIEDDWNPYLRLPMAA
jgi:5-methylcytosine-specific restriction endonuclease McrA